MIDQRLTVGSEYEVRHRRKGRFRIRVTADLGDEWVHGVIVQGVAQFMGSSDRGEGEKIIMRRSFCRFNAVDA